MPLARAAEGASGPEVVEGFDLGASRDRISALVEAGATSFSATLLPGLDTVDAISRWLDAVAGAFPR